MIKQEMKFKDFNGVERKEDFWFHLSQAEIMDFNLTTPGGLEAMIQNIVDAQDIPSLIAMFKKIILMSVGKKSADGRNFIKNQEIIDDFTSTNAYSDLYMSLITDADKAVKFINGILPDMSNVPQIEANN